MRLKTALVAAAATLAIAGPAAAHRQWLLPSTTTLAAPGDWVTVDAAVSNDLFFPDHFPMQTDRIQVWAPDGTQGRIQNAATGRYRSTFDVQIDKPGTWKIGTAQTGVMGSFKVAGAEWRVGGRRGPPGGGGPSGPGAPALGMRPAGSPLAGGGEGPGGPPRPSVATVGEIPAGATDIKLVEMTSRNEIFVTAGAPIKTVFKPTGKGLEMEPVTHPDELVANEEAQFRFLIDGKPAPGVKVTIIPGGKRYRDGEDGLELTTGSDGLVRVKWPMAGMVWLNATASDTHPSEPKASERRMSYVSTLEVLAP